MSSFLHVTFCIFSGILLVAVTSLALAQVRPPNYSPDAILETSFLCDFILTCEAHIRYGIKRIVRWPHWGRGQKGYHHKENLKKYLQNDKDPYLCMLNVNLSFCFIFSRYSPCGSNLTGLGPSEATELFTQCHTWKELHMWFYPYMWSSYQVWHWENSLVASLGPRPGRLLPQGEYLDKTQEISTIR